MMDTSLPLPTLAMPSQSGFLSKLLQSALSVSFALNWLTGNGKRRRNVVLAPPFHEWVEKKVHTLASLSKEKFEKSKKRSHLYLLSDRDERNTSTSRFSLFQVFDKLSAFERVRLISILHVHTFKTRAKTKTARSVRREAKNAPLHKNYTLST